MQNVTGLRTITRKAYADKVRAEEAMRKAENMRTMHAIARAGK